MMSVHDGHRERLRARFLNDGLDHFNDIQVLELLLFYCIPRKDTNVLAHALLDRFKTVAQVLDAPVEELKKVPGIGDSAATFLSLVSATGRYYLVSKANQVTILNTIDQCGEYLMSFFHGRRNEMVYLLCLDAKCGVLGCKMVGEGSVNSASVPVRKIVEMALAANATSVVLAHNHPSGVAVASDEDKQTTQRLAAALNMMDIELVDHLVIADDDFISMRQSGDYSPRNLQAW